MRSFLDTEINREREKGILKYLDPCLAWVRGEQKAAAKGCQIQRPFHPDVQILRTATMGGRMGLESALWHFRMRSRLHLEVTVCHGLEINLSKLAAAAVRICTLHFGTLTNPRGVMTMNRSNEGFQCRRKIRWQQRRRMERRNKNS
jgi:hypothetical protein